MSMEPEKPKIGMGQATTFIEPFLSALIWSRKQGLGSMDAFGDHRPKTGRVVWPVAHDFATQYILTRRYLDCPLIYINLICPPHHPAPASSFHARSASASRHPLDPS